MPEKPSISANAVANPPRGAEIAANMPDVSPVLPNTVANPPHGAGADGKCATNSFAEMSAIRLEIKADWAKFMADLEKLVNGVAGRLAADLAGQPAVTDHSGILPKGGGVIVYGFGENQKEPESNSATSPTALNTTLEVETQVSLNPKVVTILEVETQGSMNSKGLTTLKVKTSGLDNSSTKQKVNNSSLNPELATMSEVKTKDLEELSSKQGVDKYSVKSELAIMKVTLIQNRTKLPHSNNGIKNDQKIITGENLIDQVFNRVWQNYKKRKKDIRSI